MNTHFQHSEHSGDIDCSFRKAIDKIAAVAGVAAVAMVVWIGVVQVTTPFAMSRESAPAIEQAGQTESPSSSAPSASKPGSSPVAAPSTVQPNAQPLASSHL